MSGTITTFDKLANLQLIFLIFFGNIFSLIFLQLIFLIFFGSIFSLIFLQLIFLLFFATYYLPILQTYFSDIFYKYFLANQADLFFCQFCKLIFCQLCELILGGEIYYFFHSLKILANQGLNLQNLEANLQNEAYLKKTELSECHQRA